MVLVGIDVADEEEGVRIQMVLLADVPHRLLPESPLDSESREHRQKMVIDLYEVSHFHVAVEWFHGYKDNYLMVIFVHRHP